MVRNVILVLLLNCVLGYDLVAQLALSGQTAAHFVKSSSSDAPRSVNHGRASFGWESDLFMDASISDHVTAFGTVRLSESPVVAVEYASIRLIGLLPLDLNVEVGKFTLPFGGLGERRYPRRNPLFGLPLIYEYETALPDWVTTEEQILAARGRGSGLRLLDRGMYDIGAMLTATWGIVDFAAAVSSGTVSETTYGTGNANSELGTVVRLAITPLTGLTVGTAYARGAYLAEGTTAAGSTVDLSGYRQQAAEMDLEFSRGHVIFFGQAVYSSWPVPLRGRDVNMGVVGYYAEGKYTLIPRLYAALRMSGLRFGKTNLGGQEQRWDFNANEWEGGFGFFLERDVLLKLVRRETRTYGGSNPKDGLTVLQLVVAY